jgi:cytochrome c oxidase subunit 2
MMPLTKGDCQFSKTHFDFPEAFASLRQAPLSHSFCQHTDESGIAPLLKGLHGSTSFLNDGLTVVASEAYIRESIVDPGAQRVQGYDSSMPPFEHLNDEELEDLMAYIMTLE